MSIKEEHQSRSKIQNMLDIQKKRATPLLRKWLKKDFIKSKLEKMNTLPKIKNE